MKNSKRLLLLFLLSRHKILVELIIKYPLGIYKEFRDEKMHHKCVKYYLLEVVPEK
jgi:hypothetical protein